VLLKIQNVHPFSFITGHFVQLGFLLDAEVSVGALAASIISIFGSA
jgi:hypothetical protein